MEYHPLTEIVFNTKKSEDVDGKIRQYLSEKAKTVDWHENDLRKLLDLQEESKSLEDKLLDSLSGKSIETDGGGMSGLKDLLISEIDSIAQIAKEHSLEVLDKHKIHIDTSFISESNVKHNISKIRKTLEEG